MGYFQDNLDITLEDSALAVDNIEFKVNLDTSSKSFFFFW